jgi:hypothetical protein
MVGEWRVKRGGDKWKGVFIILSAVMLGLIVMNSFGAFLWGVGQWLEACRGGVDQRCGELRLLNSSLLLTTILSAATLVMNLVYAFRRS